MHSARLHRRLKNYATVSTSLARASCLICSIVLDLSIIHNLKIRTQLRMIVSTYFNVDLALKTMDVCLKFQVTLSKLQISTPFNKTGRYELNSIE